MIRVLITGAGAPGIFGTIYALRNNNDKREFYIVTVDVREEAIGRYISDKFYKVPKATDENFIDVVLDIVKKEKIDVILPQVTLELEKFSENVAKFKKYGVDIVVNPLEILRKMNNKYFLMKEFASLGYNQGIFDLIRSKEDLIRFAEEIGYPKNKFVVKLPISNGMRGLRIISKERVNLKKFINEKPMGLEETLDEILKLYEEKPDLELIAMEFFPGEEYTVDVYRSPLSGKTVVVTRTRDVIRTGITFEGRLEKNEELIEKSKNLAEKMGSIYCFGFQFKRMKNGEFGLLESNPRVQGTMIMSVLGGADMIYWSVIEAKGEQINFENLNIRWGLKFKRYWGGLGILNGEIQKI